MLCWYGIPICDTGPRMFSTEAASSMSFDSDNTPTANVDSVSDHWATLAGRVQAFMAAWDDEALPELHEFAPKEPLPLRCVVLAELVKVDLDRRAAAKLPPKPVEEYFQEFPELVADEKFPCDLVYEEYSVRRRHGDKVTLDDFVARFPKHEAALRRLLNVETYNATTCLVSPVRVEEFQAGQTIDDFDLLTQLGKGAFATVFLARQRSLQRLVALKISSNRGSEPQTLAQLDHPHIVRVYDQRILPKGDIRLLYMQYAPAGTLADVLEAVRRLPPDQWKGSELVRAVDEALDRRGEEQPPDSSLRRRLQTASWAEAVCWFGVQLASALDYAHQRGVLHRDIKPANILLSAEGAPKLADFNISFCNKVEGASPAAYFGGSLAYMSPEQLEACNPSHFRQPESLDGRSDLYALGVVLWELLTGRRPFKDVHLGGNWNATLEEMVAQRSEGPDVRVLQFAVPACPRPLQDVLLRLLSFDPEQRYANAAEAAAELRLCLEPGAQHLMDSRSAGWKYVVRRFPILSILVAATIPNVLAAWFNFEYNAGIIAASLAESLPTFYSIAAAVNAVAFPLGMALGVAIMWPMARAMRWPDSAETMAAARRRCLKLPHYLAIISIAEWLIAGVVYPFMLTWLNVGMHRTDALHFFGSLTLCGLIAGAYPFLAVAAMAAGVYYPALMRPHWPQQEEVKHLRWLHTITGRYLVMAISLPLLGVALLVTIGAENRLAMGILSLGGFAALWPAFRLSRQIQHNLSSLVHMIEVSHEPLSSSTQSFSASFD